MLAILFGYNNNNMSENVKSALVPGQSKKQSKFPSSKEIEYKQTPNLNDAVGELSDEEKEKEFNRLHDEYIHTKMERKEELMRLKKEEFGSSSSSEEEESKSSEEEIEEKGVKKVESKRSKGKQQLKKSLNNDAISYPVILQLKKSSVQCELVFLEKQFQLNKKVIPFIKINKLTLSAADHTYKVKQRLKIGITGEDEILLELNEKVESKNKILNVFLRFLRVKLDLKSMKLQEESRCNLGQFGELAEGALIYDKIFKKSQIIGMWEQRYVVVKGEGVFSYRGLKAKPTMQIGAKDVIEIQTQCELYKQQLVIKLVYKNDKTDFGLPLDLKLQWVTAFVGLLQ